MKKNIKNTIIAIFALAIIGSVSFVACNKSEDLIADNEQEEFQPFYSSNDEITHEMAILIGQRHNMLMTEAIKGLPISHEELKYNFNKINYEPTIQIKNEIYDYFASIDMNTLDSIIFKELLNTTSTSLCKQIIKIIHNDSNFETKSNDLNNLIPSINNLLSRDKQLLLVFIETSRYSLQFWMEANKGGGHNGSGYETMNAAINWNAIACADGLGAAGTLLRTWYLAGFGPLSWGTIVGAVGFGAAWASGSAILTQLMF